MLDGNDPSGRRLRTGLDYDLRFGMSPHPTAPAEVSTIPRDEPARYFRNPPQRPADYGSADHPTCHNLGLAAAFGTASTAVDAAGSGRRVVKRPGVVVPGFGALRAQPGIGLSDSSGL